MTMTFWFFALLFIFAVVPPTLLGMCIVSKGDPKAPDIFGGSGFGRFSRDGEQAGKTDKGDVLVPKCATTNPFLPNSRPMEDWERKDSDEFFASHFRGGIEGSSTDAIDNHQPLRTISMQDRINNTTL